MSDKQYVIPILALSLIVTLMAVNPAEADNALNGASPRPFYVFGHNPNTLANAENDLIAGANALEPDITLAYPDTPSARCSALDPLQNLVDWDSSFPNRDGVCSDTKLVDWLDGVHDLALRFTNLALVVFDVKPSAALPEYGLVILEAIRTHLNGYGYGAHQTTTEVRLNVIISVATHSNFGIFDNILATLGPREGVQVDAEDDAGAVVDYFFSRGYYDNIAYGDGTAGFGTTLPPAMDGAVGIRAAFGYPKAVTYVYTIESPDTMRLYIDAGVDGIIPDQFPPVTGLEFLYVASLRSVVDGRSDIRLATRDDNPFKPLNEAYALKINTMDQTDAGTDANLSFTLNGSLGASSITVNTAVPGRMESGDQNWVTIPSKNLGALRSITIQDDGTGNAPDWDLSDITVYSARWLGVGVYTGFALHQTISGNSPVTLSLPVDEYVWGGFGPDPAVTPTHWQKFIDAYNWVAPGGTIHIATGNYNEKLTMTKPCTVMFSSDHGTGPAVVGSP